MILNTPHPQLPPAPAFLDDDPLPQCINGSAPALTLREIELRLKSVRKIEKFTKVRANSDVEQADPRSLVTVIGEKSKGQ